MWSHRHTHTQTHTTLSTYLGSGRPCFLVFFPYVCIWHSLSNNVIHIRAYTNKLTQTQTHTQHEQHTLALSGHLFVRSFRMFACDIAFSNNVIHIRACTNVHTQRQTHTQHEQHTLVLSGHVFFAFFACTAPDVALSSNAIHMEAAYKNVLTQTQTHTHTTRATYLGSERPSFSCVVCVCSRPIQSSLSPAPLPCRIEAKVVQATACLPSYRVWW
jgi:hypothetical protein